MKQPRRQGRTPAKRTRIPVTMRIRPDLHDKITARAATRGHSLTAEMELLVEQAALLEQALGGPTVGPFVRHVIAALVDTTRDDWLADPAAYTGAMARTIETMADAFPGGFTRDALDQATAAVRAKLVAQAAS